MDLTYAIKPFDEFSLLGLYNVMHLRDLVFVVGQKITAVCEIDGLDPQCWHATVHDGDKLIGTTRVFMDETPVVVGRVAVHPDYQRTGIGTKMMAFVQEHIGSRAAELHAQAYLEDWYGSLGWTRVGDVYEEAEIAHVTMTLNSP